MPCRPHLKSIRSLGRPTYARIPIRNGGRLRCKFRGSGAIPLRGWLGEGMGKPTYRRGPSRPRFPACPMRAATRAYNSSSGIFSEYGDVNPSMTQSPFLDQPSSPQTTDVNSSTR